MSSNGLKESSSASKQITKITASVVLYKTPNWQIEKLITGIAQSSVPIEVYLVDNSPVPLSLPCFTLENVKYIRSSENKGYGHGHNIALRSVLKESTYHLILNPDISFEPKELEKIIKLMDSDHSIGMVMPKVVYPDGEMQNLCKLLPTPADLILRRLPIGPLKAMNNKSMMRFEMRDADFEKTMDVPYLSGCFMACRVTALEKIGLFDERYFMYLEDTDLSRRMHAQFRTVYYPGATIVHEHARESYKNKRLLWIHISSAVRYFNKWGWLIDPERARVNQVAMKRNLLQAKEGKNELNL